MNKSSLKAVFINAKMTGTKYIGVSIQTEGSSRPEIIINPKENFGAKFDYYMEAYDDDLVLITTKGKKDIRITGAAEGETFADIENQLIAEQGKKWKRMISDALDRAYERMLENTPLKSEEEKVQCDAMKEAYKGMFLNSSRTVTEERFIYEHIAEYEELFDICLNGNDLEFKKRLVNMKKMQNEYVLEHENE